jgi:hypothetical protein
VPDTSVTKGSQYTQYGYFYTDLTTIIGYEDSIIPFAIDNAKPQAYTTDVGFYTWVSQDLLTQATSFDQSRIGMGNPINAKSNQMPPVQDLTRSIDLGNEIGGEFYFFFPMKMLDKIWINDIILTPNGNGLTIDVRVGQDINNADLYTAIVNYDQFNNDFTQQCSRIGTIGNRNHL